MKKVILLAALIVASLAVTAQPRCKGTKKDGTPCRMVIINKDGYCRFHALGVKHCEYIRPDKTRCNMTVKENEHYCRFHTKG